MPRYSFLMPLVPNYGHWQSSFSQYALPGTSETRARALIEAWRDLFLNGDGLGNPWNVALPGAVAKVGEIAEYGTSNGKGRFFEVELIDSDTSLIVGMALENQALTDRAYARDAMPGGSADSYDYFQYVEDAPNTGTNGHTYPAIWFAFSADNSVDRFNIPYSDLPTLSFGGDYNSAGGLPAANGTAAAAWFPDKTTTQTPRGLEFVPKNVASGYTYDDFLIIIDTDKPAILISQAQEGLGNCHTAGGFAKVLPRQTSDTNDVGVFWIEIEAEDDDPNHGEGYFECKNAAGTVVSYDLSLRKIFDPGNEVDAAGDYYWSPVEVYTSGDLKGWLDTDLFREIGAVDQSYHRKAIFEGPSADKPFIRHADALAWMHQEDTPSWPFWYKGRLKPGLR
jgi:hypothetical protein